MNPWWQKNPRRVETPDEPVERLDPPGLTYLDAADKDARVWDVINEQSARIARLEQQVRDLSKQSGEHARLRARVTALETRVHDMEQLGETR